MNIELTADEIEFLTAALTNMRRTLKRRHNETMELVDLVKTISKVTGEGIPRDIHEAKQRYLKAYSRDALFIDKMLNKFRNDTHEGRISMGSIRKIVRRNDTTVVQFENGMEVCSNEMHTPCRAEDYLRDLPTIHVFDNERDA